MAREKLSFALTTVLALLLLVNGLSFFMYRQQNSVIEQQKAELESVLSRSSLLDAEQERLNYEISQVREMSDYLVQEIAQQEALEKERALAGGGGPTAYLTIDDGPSKVTIEILEILADYGIEATFFVIGFNNSGDENIYRRIVNEGHALGNHTYTHYLNTIYRSVDSFMADLLRLEEHLYEQTGIRPDIVRFPGGSSNTVARSDVMRDLIHTLLDQGYDYFDWNVSSGDGNSSLPADQLVKNVLTQVDRLQGHDAVILFHDTYLSHNTAKALPQIIEELQARGYDFAPLSKGVINMKHR